MATTAEVANLYQLVINDVCKNMAKEFANEGLEDHVIQNLQNVCI